MSLDVYLIVEGGEPRGKTERIYVREDGATREVTRGEWDELHPGVEPVAVIDEMDDGYVYEANITHNLGRMAEECGLYAPLWRPDLIDATHARDLLGPLRVGLEELREDRERLQEFNPANGWGDYDGLVRFTENYLAACREFPIARIRVSR